MDLARLRYARKPEDKSCARIEKYTSARAEQTKFHHSRVWPHGATPACGADIGASRLWYLMLLPRAVSSVDIGRRSITTSARTPPRRPNCPPARRRLLTSITFQTTPTDASYFTAPYIHPVHL